MTVFQNSDSLRVCPECGSNSVDFSELEGGVACCRTCKWVGTKGQLMTIPFDVRMGSPTEVMLAMQTDMRKVLSVNAKEFIRFLVKWGFVPVAKDGGALLVPDKQASVRYINAIARGCLNAIFDARQKLDKEKMNDN